MSFEFKCDVIGVCYLRLPELNIVYSLALVVPNEK